MSKGIPGLLYLDQLDITNAAGLTCSIRAYRDVLATVERLQVDQVQDITLTEEVLPSNQPYFNSVWTLVSTGASVANAQFEFSSVIEGDFLTINGLIYTAVDGAKSDNTEFDISGGDLTAAADITDSIDNDTRVGTFGDIDASEGFGVVDLDQTITGSAGNNTTFEVSNSTRITILEAFVEGFDPDVYTLTFISETNLEVGSIPPVGLTTKRPLDIAFTGSSNEFTVRSLISVINWIERTSEVKVSSQGLGTQATATVTFATVLAGDTVTINGLAYLAVAGAKSDNTEFSIDSTDAVDAADLTDSIQNDTRTGNLADITATSALGIVTLSSTAVGALGNAVTLVSSNGVRLALSGALFTGGADNQDGTFTDAIFKGATPYLTYTWTVVKLGDVYTLTSTASS